MNKISLTALAALILGLGFQQYATAHCEVPCGIYGDQQRFEAMLEDHTTVAKAMKMINELAGETGAQAHNQLARWIANKELHASKIQDTIAQYFMHQRIKPKDPKYVDKLTKAHAVMLAAMKCKQNVAAEHGDALKAAIIAFHKAYEAT
jgi:nickel superoxide dismutase